VSEVSVGPVTGDDELIAFANQHRRTYNWSQESYDDFLDKREERAPDIRVVRHRGHVAGGLFLIPMGQWFGGRSVPMAGIGGVGIDPQQRASGMASALMRSVLEELHANGFALSALYPATVPVYRRAGYEMAGSYVTYTLESHKIDVRDRHLAVALCPLDRELLEPMYTQRAQQCNGNLDRSQKFWRRITDDPKKEIHAYAVGSDEGYVVFRQVSEKTAWGYDLALRDVVALTPGAARRLWTFLADHRSFAPKVRWNGAVGDPFTFVLREQEWEVEKQWSWMLRVVDVERALAERGYAPSVDAELHLDVADDVLGVNAGPLVLRVAGGKGEVTRGGRGSLKIDVRGLAPLYTGFLSAEQLKPTGYIAGPDNEMAAATAVFAGAAPWLADFF
jgi:predicted acetyltransferase